MSPRSRVTIFLSCIVFITAAVQWHGLGFFLDSLAGGMQWSSGLVDLLRVNTQGLIVFVLLGLFLEWSGIRQSASERHREFETAQILLSRALQSNPCRALVEAGLQPIYGTDAAKQLARSMFCKHPILKDVSVTISVSRDASTDFIVDIELCYKSNQEKFLVTVAQNPSHIEALLLTGVISEGFNTQEDIRSVPATVRRIEENIETGQTAVHELAFHEIIGKQKINLLRAAHLENAENAISIYEARSNKAKIKNASSDCLYRVSFYHKQTKEMPYTYWLNDRVSKINHIEIDLRRLGKEIYQYAKIYRFISATQGSIDASFDTGICLIPLNAWCIAGDGIMVVWSEGHSLKQEASHVSNSVLHGWQN